MKIIKYAPLFLLFSLFISYFNSDSSVSSVIRYDKYELFFSAERLILLSATLLFLKYTMKIVIGKFWWSFYPSNLFLLLFLLLVLPGVLFTSDFSSIGNTSFYGYLLSLVLFLVGLLISHFIVKKAPPSITPKKVYSSKSITFRLMLLLFGFGFIISITRFDYSNSVFSSLFSFFNTGNLNSNLAEIRQIAPKKDFLSILVSYSLQLFMPFSAVFFLVNGAINKNKIHTYLSLVMIFAIIILTISGGGRLKALFFAMYVVTAYTFIKPISFSYIINITSVLLWFLILQTIALGRISYAVEGSSIFETIIISLNRLVERVFLTKGYATQKIFEYIPNYTDYRYGETIVTTLLGKQSDTLPLSQEMFIFIYGSGSSGTAGPQAFGEAYANFGVVGMLFYSLILGILVQLCTIFVRNRLSLDPLKIAFLAYFTVLISRIGYSDILTFKANGLHILLFLYLLIILTRNTLKKVQ